MIQQIDHTDNWVDLTTTYIQGVTAKSSHFTSTVNSLLLPPVNIRVTLDIRNPRISIFTTIGAYSKIFLLYKYIKIL